MIYIRNIFKQDLRDGKQIAFPKESSNLFFLFDYSKPDPDREISFTFNNYEKHPNYIEFHNQIIKTRLYAAGSESRIDGQLKGFLKDSLHAEIDDIIIFKRLNQTSFTFDLIPKKSSYYMLFKQLLGKQNHEVVIEQGDNLQQNKNLNSDNIPRNKIIYGAPGTGKSYELREQAEGAGFDDDNIIRITFHPNYSYQQFVGSYKPSPIYKNVLQEGAELYGSDKSTLLDDADKKEPLIDYRFVAGPLMKQLVYALNNPGKNYLLIIEEINRAPVSSVFGDVFQLLDRNEDGTSEYSITFNEEAMSFLRANRILNTEIKLPNNLFIWATMNSADQGVMPLDAAFKRRWAFEYLPLNEKQSKVEGRKIEFQKKDYDWNSFRKQINDKLKDLGIVEDKLIGPFFMNSNELSDENSIKNKLLLYLRDDVVRHNPESLFKKKTYSDIIEMYSNGENIFVNLEIKGEAPSADAEVGQE